MKFGLTGIISHVVWARSPCSYTIRIHNGVRAEQFRSIYDCCREIIVKIHQLELAGCFLDICTTLPYFRLMGMETCSNTLVHADVKDCILMAPPPLLFILIKQINTSSIVETYTW